MSLRLLLKTGVNLNIIYIKENTRERKKMSLSIVDLTLTSGLDPKFSQLKVDPMSDEHAREVRWL